MANDAALGLSTDPDIAIVHRSGVKTSRLVYVNPSRVEIGYIRDATLDMAVGASENNFELTVGIERELLEKSGVIYLEGLKRGGIIDDRKIMTRRGDGLESQVVYKGRTFEGHLARLYLSPGSTQDHIIVSGHVKDIYAYLIGYLGQGSILAVDESTEGYLSTQFKFDRYIDLYSGLRKMLATIGHKLTLCWAEGHIALGSEPITDYSGAEFDSIKTDISIEAKRPVNHLMCLGSGEGKKRIELNYYADEKGNISTKQTFFGIDYIGAKYDYPNAEREELKEAGPAKLKKMQDFSGFNVIVPPDIDLTIDDIVAGRESKTKTVVTTTISKMILRLEANGILNVEYEAGSEENSVSLTDTSESSGGGITYIAGDGITIDGRTISADVTSTDLSKVQTAASEAVRSASEAVNAANSAVKTIKVASGSPLSVERDANEVTLTHDDSGINAGSYGPVSDTTPDFGDQITLGARQSFDSEGHTTGAERRKTTIPKTEASPTKRGLMSVSDKTKLDGIDKGANAYDLPIAAVDLLGGVIPDGITITISEDGVITANVTAEASFLAAYLPGMYLETSDGDFDPHTKGGTWEKVPSLGPHKWHRLS